MKDNRYIQCILCEGIDMADSVRRFNEEMRRLKEYEPTFERDGDRFLIYVRCKQLQPENIVEAKEMKGIRHTCVECEHCVRQNNRFGVPDGRIKKAMCISPEAFMSFGCLSEGRCDSFRACIYPKGQYRNA